MAEGGHEKLRYGRKAVYHGMQDQRRIYTDWANHYLERAGFKKLIGDLQLDIHDGVILANVIEAVTNEKVQNVKCNPRNENHKLENLEACLGCLSAKGVNTQGLLARDIRDGNLKAILGLFFALSRFKQQQKTQGPPTSRHSSSTAMRGGTEIGPSKLPAPSKTTRPVLNNSNQNGVGSQGSQIARLNVTNKLIDRKQTTGGQPQTTSTTRISQGMTQNPHHSSGTAHHQQLSNGGVSNIPHPSAKTAKTTTASKSKVATDKQTLSASQKPTANGKNSMLGRLFGGSNAKERSTSKDRTTAPVQRDRGVVKDRGTVRDRTTSRDRPRYGTRSSESSTSIGTVSSSTSGQSTSTTGSSRSAVSSSTITSTSTATSASSESPKTGLKAMQRTLGKALNTARKGSPKTQRKELGVRTDPKKVAGRASRSSSVVRGDDNRHELEAKSNEINRNREREEARRTGSSEPSSSPAAAKKTNKAAGCASKGGKNLNVAKGKVQNTSGIPQPKASGNKNDSKTKANKEYDKNGKELPKTPTRGGLYGTYPGPARQRTLSPKPGQNASTQDSKNVHQENRNSSHSSKMTKNHPHNSVTNNGPLSYINSIKNTSDLSLSNHSFSTDSTASTPGTMSSGNSYSSDSSVIYRPQNEEVMTTYDKDNKAVTTFGTPEQQRAARSISELRQNLDATLQNLRSVSPSPSIRSTVETTFDNDNVVTQQMHHHPSPNSSVDTSLNSGEGMRQPMSYLRNFTPTSMLSNSMQSPLRSFGEGGPQSTGFGSRAGLNRFIPTPSSTRMYSTNSLRRTISSRSHLTEMNTDPSQIMDDISDPVNEDIASGYVSDGDILSRNAQLDEIASGYMSEGGGLLYNKRIPARYRDGMAAVRECMSKTLSLPDSDSCDDEDSSSLSSGISDTIAEMSTDENITGSSVSCSSSTPNTPSTGRRAKSEQAMSDKSGSGRNSRNSADGGEDFTDGFEDVPDGEVSGYGMKRSSSSSGNVWRKYSPTEENADKSIDGKVKDKNANLPNDKWRRGNSDLSDSGRSTKSDKDSRRSTGKDKKESSSQKTMKGKTVAKNDDKKSGTKPQQSGKNAQELKKSSNSRNQYSSNFGYRRPGGPTAGGTPNGNKTSSKVPNFGFGLKGIPGAKSNKPNTNADNSQTDDNISNTSKTVNSSTLPRSSGSKTVASARAQQQEQQQQQLYQQHMLNQQQIQQQQLLAQHHQEQQLLSQGLHQTTCASTQQMQTNEQNGYISNNNNEHPSSTSTVHSNSTVRNSYPSHSDVEISSPPMRIKDLGVAAKHGLSSPSLKRLFGRGKGDSNRSTSPSAFSDTIISNPHATLIGNMTSLNQRSSRNVTSSETQTPSNIGQNHLHVPGQHGHSSSNAELNFPSIMYNNNINYQTYPKDPYRNHTSSMASIYSCPGAWMNLGPYGSGLGNSISESGSIDSMDSGSSQLSLNSRATSERYGISTPKSPGSPLIRSNSIRSTTSEKLYPTSLSLKEFDDDWFRSISYGNLTPSNGMPLSPTHSVCSQPATRFNYPVSPTGNSGMVRSNSMSGPAYGTGIVPGMRNSSMSLDERARACLRGYKDELEEVHSSSLSLVSTTSSLYSSAEEKAAHEIRRLRKDLDESKDKVSTLSTQLATNAHVVAAFEQSLSSMTNRLQSLTSTADQKDSELRDLRETIEALKKQSAESRQLIGLPGDATLGRRSIKDRAISEPRMSRQLSTDSMSSTTSFTSLSSVGSVNDNDLSDSKSMKKKKKSWQLRTSFRSAFSRKSKNKSGAQTDVEDLDSNPSSPSYGGPHNVCMNPLLKSSASTSAIYTDGPGEQETVHELRKQLRDKEMKLTDIRLDALSSAHQLDQLKEAMNKMKNDMVTLKQENERLQRQIVQRSLGASSSQLSDISLSSSKRFSRESMDAHRISMSSEHGSLDILLDDSSGTTTNGRRVIVGVSVGHLDPSKAMGNKVQKCLIGTLSISSKTKWDALDNVVKRIFKEYVLRIDPVTNLGLNAESVFSYEVGEIHRTKDAEPPELLPCGYLVGDSNSITIHLKNVLQGSCDALVFETLIPKSVMQRYISLLLEHRRIILCGPSGTGKTYLAQKLAEHIVLRSGKEASEGSIATFNVDHKSCKELKQYLSNIADQCESNASDLPSVIILDNLHHVGSLGEVFNGFLSCRYTVSPYIIGTMNQATCSTTNLQLHHNFRWVLCANHMEPVKGFLGRYLRRKLIETEVQTSQRNNDLNKIIDWMPKVWSHLNKFLETHNSSDVTIGPRLFLSCPIDLAGSQVWFTDLWNYSIVPYLLEAVREGLQMYGRKSQWEDPAEWVTDSYPWSQPSTSDWPSLLRLRPEDVGFEGYRSETGGKSTQSAQSDAEGDPLLNMLIRLQEAANYATPPNCHSDSDSSSLNSMTLDNSIESTL